MTDLCAGYPLGSGLDQSMRGNGSGHPPSDVPGNGHKPAHKTMSELMQDPCAGCEAPCCRYLYFPFAGADDLYAGGLRQILVELSRHRVCG